MDSEYAGRLLQTARPAAASSSEPQDILHTAFSAIVQGDYEAFGQLLADDVELSICGFSPIDGTWRGRAAVVDATRKNFALLSGQQPEIERIIRQGDCIAVLLRESGVLKSSGQAYSVRGVQWFTFAEGKIGKIDEIVASIWKAATPEPGV
jgi:ketosteroid isomerase-like protein